MSLPSCSTSEFQAYFDTGQAIWCVVPVSSGRILHLFVVYGYHGADLDPDQLVQTDHLMNAVLFEVAVVTSASQSLLLEVSTWTRLESPAWPRASLKGSGWMQPQVTSKACWDATTGDRRDFCLACPSALAASAGCSVLEDRWSVPHLAVGSWLDLGRWKASWRQAVDR